MGIEAERFNAIKLANGALGCSLSHLKCLETAKEKNRTQLLVVEDDIKFLDPSLFKNQLNKFFMNHNNWDVVIVGGGASGMACARKLTEKGLKIILLEA